MTITITQITDSHISLQHPHRTDDMAQCIESINAMDPLPDAVVHTGDISHDALPGEYQIAHELLSRLSVPWYVMAGNRDNRPELIKVFANEEYLPADTEFVQYSIEQFSVRLIMVDTLSQASNRGQLCARRLAYLEQLLAADRSRRCALFLHHTPFEVAEIPHPQQFEDWQDVANFEAVIARHTQLQGIYCGHVHRNVEGRVGQLPASALSCMATDLRKGQLSDTQSSRPMLRNLQLG